MSERVGRAIELLSIVVIGYCVLAFGWVLLRNAGHFQVPASIVLVILAIAQIAALRRNRAAGGPAYGLRATRDVAFLAAIAFALLAVNGAPRWAIGSCIATVEFALVLEVFARLVPAPPAL